MYEVKTNQTVTELCEEFCQDIDSIATKNYLVPALISHVAYWKSNLSEEIVKQQVNSWFNNLRIAEFGFNEIWMD